MTEDDVPKILSAGSVLVELSVKTKSELLSQLSLEASRKSGLPVDALYESLAQRESLGSTGIGGGIAVPHATIQHLEHPLVIVARLRQPVDYDAIDDQPVDIVCLLLSPPGQHIAVLSGMIRRMRRGGAIAGIRAAGSAEAILDILASVTGPEPTA